MHAALLALTFASAAPVLKDKPAGPLTIIGEVVAESVVREGQPTPDPAALRYTFTAAGGWETTRDGKKWYAEARGYALDPSARPPAIDLKCDVAAADGRPLRGIYRLDN